MPCRWYAGRMPMTTISAVASLWRVTAQKPAVSPSASWAKKGNALHCTAYASSASGTPNQSGSADRMRRHVVSFRSGSSIGRGNSAFVSVVISILRHIFRCFHGLLLRGLLLRNDRTQAGR